MSHYPPLLFEKLLTLLMFMVIAVPLAIHTTQFVGRRQRLSWMGKCQWLYVTYMGYLTLFIVPKLPVLLAPAMTPFMDVLSFLGLLIVAVLAAIGLHLVLKVKQPRDQERRP